MVWVGAARSLPAAILRFVRDLRPGLSRTVSLGTGPHSRTTVRSFRTGTDTPSSVRERRARRPTRPPLSASCGSPFWNGGDSSRAVKDGPGSTPGLYDAFGPPPTSWWLVLVRPRVFTVASVRILPGADSPARREVLSCLPKKVPKEGHPDFAREPCSRALGPAALNSLRCASLRHPAPSPGPRTLPQGAPYGRGRSKPNVSPRFCLTIGIAARTPPAPASRARHAMAEGRACRRCSKT